MSRRIIQTGPDGRMLTNQRVGPAKAEKPDSSGKGEAGRRIREMYQGAEEVNGEA